MNQINAIPSDRSKIRLGETVSAGMAEYDKDKHPSLLQVAEEADKAMYARKQYLKETILKKDDIYYKMSGGGITFGGGEPLLQSAFIHEVCKFADPMWKIRIETSLNVPWRLVEPVVSDIDEWIIDIKETHRDIYKKYTGKEMDYVIDNLYRIKKHVEKKSFRIRIPKIPGYNNGKMIHESEKWVRDTVGVKPEIFDYIIPATFEIKNSGNDHDVYEV